MYVNYCIFCTFKQGFFAWSEVVWNTVAALTLNRLVSFERLVGNFVRELVDYLHQCFISHTLPVSLPSLMKLEYMLAIMTLIMLRPLFLWSLWNPCSPCQQSNGNWPLASWLTYSLQTSSPLLLPSPPLSCSILYGVVWYGSHGTIWKGWSSIR